MSVAVGSELEILIGAKTFLRMSDAPLYRHHVNVVGKDLDVAGAVGARPRIDRKVDPAGARLGQLAAVIDQGDFARAGIEPLAVDERPFPVGGDKCAGLVGVGPQPHRSFAARAARGAALRLYAGGGHEVGLDRGEKPALVQPQRQERAEIALSAGNLALPLGDDVAMIVARDRFGQFHGEAVPDALVVRHPQLLALPNFGALAAAFLLLLAISVDGKFESAGSAANHFTLKLDGSGVLLVVALIIQTTGFGKISVFKSVGKQLGRCGEARNACRDSRTNEQGNTPRQAHHQLLHGERFAYIRKVNRPGMLKRFSRRRQAYPRFKGASLAENTKSAPLGAARSRMPNSM